MSYIAPCVLALHTHLTECHTKCVYISNVCDALTASPIKRFEGIFIRCKMNIATADTITDKTPFGEEIYLIAATLNPTFSFMWIDADGPRGVVRKEDLKEEIRGNLHSGLLSCHSP